MNILAIDPGSSKSGVVELCGSNVYGSAKIDNEEVLDRLKYNLYNHVVIERIVLRVKAWNSLRDTCEWIGRFWESASINLLPIMLLTRSKVLSHHDAANDAEIVKRMKARGYKGLRRDEWQALALGLTFIDLKKKEVAA